jgi:hypothetical protein
MKDFFEIGLPKWPALIVKGNRVTENQAKEILIRTDGFYFSSNDKEFEREINFLIYGFRENDLHEAAKKAFGFVGYNDFYEWKDTKEEPYRILELTYLNNSRIISSWIGGSHGWCDWSGNIGCCNYNIGKWPSVEEVYKDWSDIAKNFPYLDLTCQLLDSEAGESDKEQKALIEFRVKNGKVDMSIPESIICETVDVDFVASRMFGERGCTPSQLKDALEYTKEIMKSIKFVPIKN